MAEDALVRFENVDGIGVITVDHPPVDALSPGVPEGIVESAKRKTPIRRSWRWCWSAREKLYCRRRHPPVRHPPRIPSRPHQILDANAKPVVAAIYGYALGGGLEIALASH
jgi:3-hydroxyacyl-CoA dehydrogenase